MRLLLHASLGLHFDRGYKAIAAAGFCPGNRWCRSRVHVPVALRRNWLRNWRWFWRSNRHSAWQGAPTPGVAIPFHGDDEAIAELGQGFDELGTFGESS